MVASAGHFQVVESVNALREGLEHLCKFNICLTAFQYLFHILCFPCNSLSLPVA